MFIRMISEKDLKILAHLRNNARKKVTHISKEMDIPVTTVYDKIAAHHRKGIVKKHVTLVDFSKLGYNTKALVALKAAREKRDELGEFLSNHPNINSLYRVNFDHDYVAEMIFEDPSRLQQFIDDTEIKFNLESTKIFNIVNEIKKEEFLGGK